jgi:hypothetical protein
MAMMGQMSDTRVLAIRFDAGRGTYAARVDVRRGAAVFRYPCEVQGTPDSDQAIVAAALAARALAMSDSLRA